jgi:hypothetical protein
VLVLLVFKGFKEFKDHKEQQGQLVYREIKVRKEAKE